MASFLTHAAIPLLTGRRLGLPPRALAVGAAVGCLADLDVVGYLFEVRTDDAWGHRGLAHSLAIAVLLGLSSVALAKPLPTARRRTVGFLLFCALSHPLLDALSFGDAGVALLAPFTFRRMLLGLHLVPVFPLGVPEAFSSLGAMVLLDELLWLSCPWALMLWGSRALPAGGARVWLAATVAWLSLFVSLRRQLPEIFGPPVPRLLRASLPENLASIPHGDLPQQRLITRLDELQALGLFGKALEPQAAPWSSGFFPAWFGAEAGRWSDGRLTLIARTFSGFEPPAPAQLRSLLERSDRGEPAAQAALFSLSPTEKYDLALGDYALTSTRDGLRSSHNARPRPRFWYGLCDGVAAAAATHPEPFREVVVKNPDGHAVRFHPNDLKALLAVNSISTTQLIILGGLCDASTLDTGRQCSMNAGDFVLTVLNRLGLARASFLLDAHPTQQTQFYPVASARVTLGAARPVDDTPATDALAGKVSRLVDFDAVLQLSSTTLSSSAADVPDGPGRYAKVGARTLPFHWSGTLALGADSEILGGRWTGEPANGPDCIVFPEGAPRTNDAGTLVVSPTVRPGPVERLAALSAGAGEGALVVSAADLEPLERPDAGP